MSTLPNPAVSAPVTRDKWWLGLLFTVLLIIGLGVTILTAGHVAGVEFSPQTLERRQFSFYEVPWVHWQVRAVRYQPAESELETFLKAKPYFGKLPPAATTWHLVTGWHGWTAQNGPAEILIQYFDSRDYQGHLQWEGWTEDHPQLAAELWPFVQTLATNNQYLKIPEAMDQAKRADTAEELKAALAGLGK